MAISIEAEEAKGLINKAPVDSKSEYKARIRVTGNPKIIVGKLQSPLLKFGAIEVFGPYETFERTDSEINVCGNIGAIADLNAVL